MNTKPTDRTGESIQDTSNNYAPNNTSLSTKLNHTICILKTYAFLKTSQYYSSKGNTCILDKYHNEIIEYFITNNMDIDKFYNSTINKSEFVSSVVQHISNKTENTQNKNNYQLQSAIKRFYTILQAHKHINHNKSISEPILDIIAETKFDPLNEINQITHTTNTKTMPRPRNKSTERRNSIKDEIIYELSRTKSEVLTLKQNNYILKDVADDTQKKLLETEQEKLKYKHTVNVLQQQLELEQNQISKVNDANKQLEEKKDEMIDINKKLSQENEQLKQLVLRQQNINKRSHSNSLSLSNYYNQSNMYMEKEERKEEQSDNMVNSLEIETNEQLINATTCGCMVSIFNRFKKNNSQKKSANPELSEPLLSNDEL